MIAYFVSTQLAAALRQHLAAVDAANVRVVHYNRAHPEHPLIVSVHPTGDFEVRAFGIFGVYRTSDTAPAGLIPAANVVNGQVVGPVHWIPRKDASGDSWRMVLAQHNTAYPRLYDTLHPFGITLWQKPDDVAPPRIIDLDGLGVWLVTDLPATPNEHLIERPWDELGEARALHNLQQQRST